MRIPYVIDNETHRLADVLNAILAEHGGRSLDAATAYFNLQGFRMLRDGLGGLASFRLLLGDEPVEGKDIGLRPRAAAALRSELNGAPFSEDLLRAVEDFISYLRRPEVAVRAYQQGFLHAKAYLFYGDRPSAGWDRFQPVAAIVGSSNLTGPGLTTNKELNLAHKTILEPEEVADDLPTALWPDRAHSQLAFAEREERKLWASSVGARAIADLDSWFERHWQVSSDFKDELIALLDGSKFGTVDYTPYQIYMKALFAYFQDDLAVDPGPMATRSAVDLAEFQEDAVKKARKILDRYDGVLIGDSVGLGKTWIGKKLLEDHAYHLRQKALVVCPASLRKMWTDELREATIPATIVSQEELGQSDFDAAPFGDADVVLVDESHNFRSRTAQRYENLEGLISLNGGRGRDGGRKRVILLTATPINNDLFDLYNQLNLVAQGDRTYFAAAGIGDLQRYFHQARRESRNGAAGGMDSGVALFNLLEEVVVRRTRPFIRKAYPNATVRGEPVHWPERKLRTLRYDLESTYGGIYDRIVDAVENLQLAPYRLESFKKKGVERDEFEEGREEALTGIFKSRYLKRFESSVEAFRISVKRALEFLKTFEEELLGGRLLDSRSFHRALRFLDREDIEDDATPGSLADELDANVEARAFLADLPTLDHALYDLRRLHKALQIDIEALEDVWREIRDITPAKDAKLAALKELLAGPLQGRKVLLFTYYKDTARYLYRQLEGDAGTSWRTAAGDPTIRRMDSGAPTRERSRLIEAFAPLANGRAELAGTADEVDILVSTDVLSEGQNLQDCGVLVNYDLHWNPTRMVQRAGRVDRLLSPHDVVWIYNMFPDAGLEKLLGIVQRLNEKISGIDRTGFLDASVLGETVHPQNFNTLRRIRDEDGRVVEEQEQFAELASHEFLLQQLQALLDSGRRKELEDLPDGIHSGLARQDARGVFFYYTAPAPKGQGRQHFWRYVDLRDRRILDNRYLIANLIACQPDTERVVPLSGEVDIFALQEQVLDHIMERALEQRAVEEAPKIVDPVQHTVATLLRGYLNHPDIDRKQTRQLMQALTQPLPWVHVKAVKAAYETFNRSKDLTTLLRTLRSLPPLGNGAVRHETDPVGRAVRREDLHLMCFEYVWS
jgi:superfamily II DNA or RNA helicase